MYCAPNPDKDPDCAINIGKQGTGGSVQLNDTHFALTWPGGQAVTEDPALHLWDL